MLVAKLDKSFYTPRCYVVAETDKMSGNRALTQEKGFDTAGVSTAHASSCTLQP